MQKALWGQNPLRLTQGENTTGKDASHQKSLALDVGGKNTATVGSIDKFMAPWDGMVVRADGSSNNAMYIESTNAVLAPNGTVAVQRLVLIHTNKYLLSAGQTFKQGDHIYTEGTKGGVQAHIHIEGGFGTWASVSGAKLIKNSMGTWCIDNQAHLYDMLFVPDSYTITGGKGYAWQRSSAATNKEYDDVKIKILEPIEKAPSSQLLKEGWILTGEGKLYNPAGEARMVKQYDADLSKVYEAMKENLQPGEILIATD